MNIYEFPLGRIKLTLEQVDFFCAELIKHNYASGAAASAFVQGEYNLAAAAREVSFE